jgi:hypothetical protein
MCSRALRPKTFETSTATRLGGGAFIVAVCIEMLRMPLLGGNRYGSSALVEPGGQRSAGFQDVAFGYRTGVLGVVVSDCVEQFVVFVE